MTGERKEDQRSQGALSRELALSLYLPALVLALGTGIVAPSIPVFARTFDVSFATASLVLVAPAWGHILATLPTGFLLDRIGRKPVMLAGPALTALTAFLTVFAGSFAVLIVLRFVNGFAAEMWVQGRLAMIADTGRPRDRAKLITWMAGTQRFGMLFAPAIGGFAGAIDIRAPFILQGLLVTAILIPLLKLLKETKPASESSGERPKESDWHYVRNEMLRPQILFFLAAQLFANLTRGTMQGILLLYVAFAYGKDTEVLGLMQAGTAAIILPMTFITGIVMDKFGRKMTVVPGFLGFAGVAFLLGITSISGVAFVWFLVLYYLLAASQGLTAGNMQVLGADLAPERARGRFFSIQRLAGETGGAMSPTTFGILAAISYGLAFGFVGACGLTVALIIAFKVKDTVGRSRDSEEVRRSPQPAPP